MTDARRWRSVDPALRWYVHPDESEVVAFCPKSGSVHLLTAPVRPLLAALTREALTFGQIAELFRENGLSSDDAAGALASLDEAGLIEPLP